MFISVKPKYLLSFFKLRSKNRKLRTVLLLVKAKKGIKYKKGDKNNCGIYGREEGFSLQIDFFRLCYNDKKKDVKIDIL